MILKCTTGCRLGYRHRRAPLSLTTSFYPDEVRIKLKKRRGAHRRDHKRRENAGKKVVHAIVFLLGYEGERRARCDMQ